MTHAKPFDTPHAGPNLAPLTLRLTPAVPSPSSRLRSESPPPSSRPWPSPPSFTNGSARTAAAQAAAAAAAADAGAAASKRQSQGVKEDGQTRVFNSEGNAITA